MNNNLRPLVIIPSQGQGWISGIFRVEIAADEMVSLVYEDRSRVSAKIESLPHAVQSNFFELVRCVQDASRASGQKIGSGRLA